MTSDRAGVFGGVDTHKQVHVAAAVDAAGRLLATAEFDAAPDGYGELAGWLQSWGAVRRVGVEGTGSYGAGLARHLAAAGVEVVEVNRPNRQTRRRRGKSDTVDAEAAARAALSGEAAAVPKSADGCVEAIRTLSVARRSAVKARTVAANQIDAVAVTAPEQVKDLLRGLNTPEMIKICARWRIGAGGAPAAGAAKRALRALARRHRALTAEIDELDAELLALCEQANPALLGACGVGAETAAALLTAAGDNPERMRSEASFAEVPQTPHRTRDLPAAHPPAPSPPRSRPAPTPQPTRPHPRRRSPSPPHPHHPHLSTRTRPLPQPRPRRALPTAPRPNHDLTNIGASPSTRSSPGPTRSSPGTTATGPPTAESRAPTPAPSPAPKRPRLHQPQQLRSPRHPRDIMTQPVPATLNPTLTRRAD